MAGLLQSLDATRDQAGGKQRLLGKPDVEMHPGLFEIAAAVGELLGEHEVVHVLPVLAEQSPGVGDQGVEVRFALLRGFGVGALPGRASRGCRDDAGQRPQVALACAASICRAISRT
jgi:hypothetical protein